MRWHAVVAAVLLLPLSVLASGEPRLAGGTRREHWIAADEILWDYAPSFPINLMSGQPFTPEQRVFVENGIGRTYMKSLYREYTPRWRAVVRRSARQRAELGLLGPVLRAEVGDTIVVHFKNNTRFPQSMHPHGVFYDKASEGTPYADGTSGAAKGDDMVPPGGTYTYIWPVPDRAGPGKNDPSSVPWLYHGHVHETADTNSGLVGVILVTARGKARPDGSPRDVDREFVSLFTIFNENVSNYLPINLARCSGDSCNPQDEEFQESNLMHSINGLLWGNNKYDMHVGERVRWHVLALGTEVDLHTPHWHGNTLLYQDRRIDTVDLLPAMSRTLDMVPDNPGTWMFHCHVNDHLDAGMMTTYTVH